MMKASLLLAVFLVLCLSTTVFCSSAVKKFATSPVSSASTSSPLLFDRIFVIALENNAYSKAQKSTVWKKIFARGAELTGNHGVVHPSQPNYVAMLAGSPLGCHNDKYFSHKSKTVIDLMTHGHVTWRAYQENYGSKKCNNAKAIGRYVRRHNPFMMSETVRKNPALCSRIVDATHLATDVKNNKLAQFSFYTPNLDNDGKIHRNSCSWVGLRCRPIYWIRKQLNFVPLWPFLERVTALFLWLHLLTILFFLIVFGCFRS
jgi:hypothetical protein